MTEAEWFRCDDPGLMLRPLSAANEPGVRKVRLIAVAYCRQGLLASTDARAHQAVEWAERAADEAVGARHLDDVSAEAWEAYEDEYDPVCEAASYAANPGIEVGHLTYVLPEVESEVHNGDRKRYADLLRCVAGNPFRPVAVDPAWQTGTVVALATGIYEERAWDRLPVLADALEDAGCDHPDVIGHCRGPGPHARGCWVVDLLLGKT